MDTTQSPHVIDRTSRFAVAAIFIGWFILDTLAVTLGSLRHGVRFFDISACIVDPTCIFFGVDSWFQRIAFGAVCILCLSAPVAAQWRGKRQAWLAYLAPLALLLTCGALLYSKTSSEFFSAPSDVNSVSSSMIRFANTLVHQGGGLVSRHICIGLGGYLALAGCVALAAQGIRQFRSRAGTQAHGV